MPNIEIHGLHQQEAEEVRSRIFDLFKDVPYVGEMVVTICITEVRDQSGQDQPFLRLISTPAPYIGEIKEKLQTLGIDIERLELKEFIPKQE